MFSISAAAAVLLPDLAAVVDRYCGAQSARPVAIVAPGETGDVVVATSGTAAVAFSAATGQLRLDVPPDGVPFAAALIAAFALGEAVPAASDPVSLALLGLATRVAVRNVAVLIAGPTGTVKEIIARYIHGRSARPGGPFVAVNCAAIPDTMIEATLFGYERGAFTGATGSAPGLFRAAAGGTLLLDEVSELPLAMQAKLLRALQEREVLPVGAAAPVRTDARIIATSNRDLGEEVAAGRFRADLFYRLAVFPLTIVALAARPADIIPITASLWLRQGITAWPTPAALARLAAHGWPGNVRELNNVLARAAVFADAGRVEAGDIVFDSLTPLVPQSLGHEVRAHEFATIRATLAACAGHRGATAQRLGISERTLRYKLAAMGDDHAVTIQ